MCALVGFAANLSVLSAFGSGGECALFSDALNHASIVDGARLAARAGAELNVFRCWTLYVCFAQSLRILHIHKQVALLHVQVLVCACELRTAL